MSQVVSRIIVGEDTTAATVLTERIDFAAYARVSGRLFRHKKLHAEGGTVNVLNKCKASCVRYCAIASAQQRLHKVETG